jgi:hypothetical protein
MGYTHETTKLIDPYLPHIQSVVDLGAQNDYRVPLPAPYTKDSYYAGKDYEAIDISGENGSSPKSSIVIWLQSAAILCMMLVALLLWAILLMGGMFTRFCKRLKKSFVR